MKALVLNEYAPIESLPLKMKELPLPIPKKGELLVKINVCGVCRTDLHLIEGDLAPGTLPIIPGHQIVGIVSEVGPECTRFKVGDRIGVAWLRYTCQACNYCLEKRENLCEHSRYTGYLENGGYAEYTTILEEYAYEIPPHFSDAEAAPLLCAGIIGYRSYKCSELPSKGRLGIFGFGSSAHIVIQVALAQGHKVFVSTRTYNHQEMAKKMGAHWVGGSEDVFPGKVDSAIVFAPVGEIVPQALRAVAKGGMVVVAGIAMSEIPAMDYEKCLFHEKKLRSVEANTRSDGKELLALAASIPIRPQITEYPMEQANEVLLELKKGNIDGTAVLRMS